MHSLMETTRRLVPLTLVLILIFVSLAGADDITDNAAVRAAFQQAWIDSYPEVPGSGGFTDEHARRQHEEGGWIVRDTWTGLIEVRRTQAGQPRDPDDPARPITLPGRPYYEDTATGTKYADRRGRYQIIAGFHTHPNSDGPDGPSQMDVDESSDCGLPEYIITDEGVFKFDPSRTNDPDTVGDERVTSEERPEVTQARNQAAADQQQRENGRRKGGRSWRKKRR